jgi:lipopolysaccharide/colanic/teichoic acid biosynthesis glycosyltransferase
MLKRLFDIVASAVALTVLAIPMLIIALAVRITSPGAAIFRQRRAGWRGKPFTMLKFRTMRADVDPYGASPRSAEDARLTPLGRFLRATSLDELPQLLNILAGQMSLVGPRPLYERQAELWNQRQRRRLEVRPGLTGYAQAYGRGALRHEGKLEMDVYYVEHQGFLLDMRIILRTVANIASGRQRVYEERYSAAKDRETD